MHAVAIVTTLLAAGDPPVPQLPWWLQYGVLGAVLVALVLPGKYRLLVPTAFYVDAKAEIEQLRNENHELVTRMLASQADSAVALAKSAEALTETTIELRALRRGRAGE